MVLIEYSLRKVEKRSYSSHTKWLSSEPYPIIVLLHFPSYGLFKRIQILNDVNTQTNVEILPITGGFTTLFKLFMS